MAGTGHGAEEDRLLSKTRSLALAKIPFSKREGGGKERSRDSDRECGEENRARAEWL